MALTDYIPFLHNSSKSGGAGRDARGAMRVERTGHVGRTGHSERTGHSGRLGYAVRPTSERSTNAGRPTSERSDGGYPANTRPRSTRPVTERSQQKNRIVRPQDKKPALLQRMTNWCTSLGYLRILVVAAVTLGLLVIAFYGPVKVWYTAYRDKQLYAQQLQVLAEQNKKLQSEVDRLQSQEGIEDEARRRGYVKANETSVTIKGTTTTTGEADAGASKDTLEEVKIKNPWYINVLDKFFMYKPSNTHV